MKKDILKEYEALIREHMEKLYRSAYRVKGNKQEAEMLTEETLIYGAKKYGGLAKKERVLDIMAEKIGKGDFTGFEEADYEAILNRAMNKIMVQDKQKKLFTSLCAGVLAVAIGVSTALGVVWNQKHTQANSIIQMNNTKIITGDNENSYLVNYHNISKTLNKKGLPDMDININSVSANDMVSVFTASDGTPYAAYHNLETENGTPTTFTLYKGTEDGWLALGSEQIGSSIIQLDPYFNSIVLSEIYVIADEKSDVYVICRLNEDILIYQYNENDGLSIKKTIPFTYIDDFRTIHVYYDSIYGKAGAIYLACNDAGDVKVYRYDTTTDTLAVFHENIKTALATSSIDFCVKNDIIHMYEFSSGGVYYHKLFSDGNKTTLKVGEKSTAEKMGGIAIDKNDNVHIVTYHQASDRRIHRIIDINGNVQEQDLERLYYQDTDYQVFFFGIFTGDDGNIYIWERYLSPNGDNAFVALGSVSGTEAGKTKYQNGFDLLDFPDALYANGKNVLFKLFDYTENSLDCSIVYFYLNQAVMEE